MELSDQLKKLRIEYGLSQEELSEKSGLSLRTIQRIENGESKPREDTLNLLAKALEISTEKFSINDLSENDLTYNTILNKIPWFLISLTTIGVGLGLSVSLNVFNDSNEGNYSDIGIAFGLFLAITGCGLLSGVILEKIFNLFKKESKI